MGYGTAQELLMLRRQAIRYSPDVVVLAFFPGNDVYDNWPPLQSLFPAESLGPRPFFYYQDGRLQVDKSFRSAPHSLEVSERAVYGSRLRRLLWHFRIWQLLYHLHYSGPLAAVWIAARTIEKAWTSGGALSDRFANVERSDRLVLNPPSGKAWRDAWRVTEGLVSETADEAQEAHARFLLVVLSESLQAYPGRAAREALLRNAGVKDPFYPNKRLAALARSRGFAVLSLGEPLQKYADEHKVFLHGFANVVAGVGHLNEAGHEITGDMIAERICAMVAPPRSTAASRAPAAPPETWRRRRDESLTRATERRRSSDP
jgi:hypothetical protein